MAGESAGVNCVVKISGVAVPFVGEVTTMGGANTTYQITDISKQVLDRIDPVHVLVKGTNDAAEAGTTTTTLKMAAHGLQTGDVIINTSRSSAKREVTYVDSGTVTVTAVTGQVSGDVIEVYKQASATTYSVNKLNGMVTFTSALARTVLISGSYLPMSVAAYANKNSRSDECELYDATAFQATYKKRVAGLKSASGTLSHFDIADTVFDGAFQSGVPVVLEDRTASGDLPNRTWVLLDSEQIEAAVNGLQNNTISWVSYDTWLRLGV